MGRDKGDKEETCSIILSRPPHLLLPPSLLTPQLRDSDNTIILETAVAANAEVIVTGNLDLLMLTKFNKIPILTFWLIS
ncbi:MAG: hypothetical protein V7K35_13890 [Nostoc sp.]|uniref:hypothetical protein n=1 Tax=Nostoc sp. TaxID=1180 RepID=UPI002FF6FBA8